MLCGGRGVCAGLLAVLMLLSGCSVDRTPRISETHRAQPIAGRIPVRTVQSVPGADFGEQPAPSFNPGPAQVGGLQCGGVFCPFTPEPIVPCCTTAVDVESGAARQVDRCGLDFGATGTEFFGAACWQRDQPGVVDQTCPSVPMPGGVQEPGCCTDQGECGSVNTSNALGCHYALDGTSKACGEDTIVDAVECDPLGTFGVRSVVDVTWGGRDGGLAALTDDGRNQIVIHLKLVVEGIDDLGELRGSIQPCSVELPPFYSTTLCESYQPVFPDSIWDSPELPQIELSGRYQCLNPGCFVTLDAQTSLLGIDLENPESPWPSPQQTPIMECAAGVGVDCFPDHDSDMLPGLSVTLLTQGMAEPGIGCNGDYVYEGAPLSASPAAIFGGVRRADQILLGTRVKLGGTGRISDDCNSGAGQGVAEFVQSRGWGCIVQEGTFNFGQNPAGPAEPCQAAEAAFMDENLPIYNVLALGQAPDPGLEVRNVQVSDGPQFAMVRLGGLGQDVSCAAVRNAVYP